MRVLVTGAAGSIGQLLTVGLADRGHDVVGFDRVPAPRRHRHPRGTPATVRTRMPWPPSSRPSPWTVSRTSRGIRTRRRCPTRSRPTPSPPQRCSTRWSSTAYGGSSTPAPTTRWAGAPRPRDSEITVEHRPRPDSFYGVGKVAAEAVMSLYADRHGLDVVSCRIGSFLPEPTTVRHLSTWLSHDDCVRMFEAALTAPAPGYAVLYGISRNTRAWWDLGARSRALGYDPADDAETFSSEDRPPRPEDEVETASRRRAVVVTRSFSGPGGGARPLVDQHREGDADEHEDAADDERPSGARRAPRRSTRRAARPRACRPSRRSCRAP